MTGEYQYDIALSFAGEDRTYVRAVADSLESHALKVFYDEYEQVQLWGKDLYEHLHEIYSSKAMYCVIFISEAYARRIWATHELKSAQERALREHGEYILPARFDDTELPGMRSTTGYIDLRALSPDEFASLVIEKIQGSVGDQGQADRPHYRVPRREPPPINPYDEAERFLTLLNSTLQNRAAALEESGSSLSIFNRGERKCVRVVRGGNTLLSLDAWLGGISSDKGLSFHAVNGEFRGSAGALSAWADLIWDEDADQVMLELHDLSLFGPSPGNQRRMTFVEFIDGIWERIVEVVERDLA